MGLRGCARRGQPSRGIVHHDRYDHVCCWSAWMLPARLAWPFLWVASSASIATAKTANMRFKPKAIRAWRDFHRGRSPEPNAKPVAQVGRGVSSPTRCQPKYFRPKRRQRPKSLHTLNHKDIYRPESGCVHETCVTATLEAKLA